MAPTAISPPPGPFAAVPKKMQPNGIESEGCHPAELDASLLEITPNKKPGVVPEPHSAEVWKQNVCTDHMITAKWTAAHGWESPHMIPYGPISLMPTASVLQYATECFEGLKLYRGFDGRLRLFRPSRNAARMLSSATRISLPGFDPAEFLKLMLKLCAVDGPKWLPRDRPGQFLYLRPTMIGSADNLGVARPTEALLYIIMCCYPSFDVPCGSKMDYALEDGGTASVPPMQLLASREDSVRAWPGGFGFAKLGSNYGPSLVAQSEAKARGFDQVLWLLGDERFVTEAGASNFFVVWRTGDGRTELVTAPLDGKIILDGITRRSVIGLAKRRLGGQQEGNASWTSSEGLEYVEVVERNFTMNEIETALGEGRLLEAFAAGTAFFVTPISRIGYGEKDLRLPETKGKTTTYASVLRKWLWNIMYGKEQDKWGVVVEEEGAPN